MRLWIKLQRRFMGMAIRQRDTKSQSMCWSLFETAYGKSSATTPASACLGLDRFNLGILAHFGVA